MPVHDWSRVDAGIFHAFHMGWNWQLQEALNAGRLPTDYYSLVEQQTIEENEDAARRTLAIRHVSGHRLVAVVEMVSPANKDRVRHVEQFVSKIAALLDAGVHVLLIDLVSPGSCDSGGMHGAIGRWVDVAGGVYQLPTDEPRTLASYRAVEPREAFLEHLAIGQSLPDMPLFFDPGRYVNVPLETTYDVAFAAMPQFWRDRLGGGNDARGSGR